MGIEQNYILTVGLLLVVLMTACSSKKAERLESSEEKPKMSLVQSSVDRIETSLSTDELAERFIKVYVEQSFNEEELANKASLLEGWKGDGSLDRALSDLQALRVELSDYLETRTIRTSASVTLVERQIQFVEVYTNGVKYLVDVSYKESSPAYSGVFDRRKLYTFKVQEGQIVQFEEVLLR